MKVDCFSLPLWSARSQEGSRCRLHASVHSFLWSIDSCFNHCKRQREISRDLRHGYCCSLSPLSRRRFTASCHVKKKKKQAKLCVSGLLKYRAHEGKVHRREGILISLSDRNYARLCIFPAGSSSRTTHRQTLTPFLQPSWPSSRSVNRPGRLFNFPRCH